MLWGRMEGGVEPPVTSRVWLQGDLDAWRPQRRRADLWRALRVAMLSAAWDRRMMRVVRGTQFGPADVATTFVASVRRLVRADWQRATSDVTDLPGAHRSWFPNAEQRAAQYGLVAFEMEWCAAGVLAHVVHGPGGRRPRLEVRLVAPTAEELVG